MVRGIQFKKDGPAGGPRSGKLSCHNQCNAAEAQILVSANINTGGYNESKEDEHDHKEENDQGCVSHKNGMNQ